MTDQTRSGREALKSLFGLLGTVPGNQELGTPAPPLQEPPAPDHTLISLPKTDAEDSPWSP